MTTPPTLATCSIAAALLIWDHVSHVIFYFPLTMFHSFTDTGWLEVNLHTPIVVIDKSLFKTGTTIKSNKNLSAQVNFQLK